MVALLPTALRGEAFQPTIAPHNNQLAVILALMTEISWLNATRISNCFAQYVQALKIAIKNSFNVSRNL